MLPVPLALAADPPHELFPASARATSWLKSNWNRFEENYHPNYAFDGDPATGWVEGAEGDGVGEAIEWPISALRSGRSLTVEVLAGYQRSPSLWKANGAPRDVRVTVLDPRGEPVASADALLAHTMDAQRVTVALPGDKSFDAVRLEIRSVWPGTKYKDTVVSEIRTFVDSDVPYDAAFESSKRAALLAWRKERLDAAAYFAKLPATYPWASTTFVRHDEQLATAPSVPIAPSVDAGGPAFRLVGKGAPPLPEGLDADAALVLARTTDFALFEARDDVAHRETDPGDPADDGAYRVGFRDLVVSNVRAAWWEDAPGQPRLLAWTSRYRSDGRELGDEDYAWVAAYSREGRLRQFWRARRMTNEGMCIHHETTLVTLTWAGERVASVEQVSHTSQDPRADGSWRCQPDAWTRTTWSPA